MRIITLANFKGGCGKTTLGHHLAVLADELGLRVVVIDTDRQGDLYRRLTSAHSRPDERPRTTFGKTGAVVYSPGAPPSLESLAALGTFDLVIIDTPPKEKLAGRVDTVIAPIDGVDAALNANETVADALAVDARGVYLVRNGLDEGGSAFEREFADLEEGLPDRVEVCPIAIPRGEAIKRSSFTNRAAWSDPYKGSDTRKMRSACEWLLNKIVGGQKSTA